MGTFGSLKTKVQRRVIDLASAVQAEVPDLINAAIKTAQQKYNFLSMHRTVTFTTVSGVNQIGVIENFKEYRDEGPYIENQLRKPSFISIAPSSYTEKVDFLSTTYLAKPTAIVSAVDFTTVNTTNFYVNPYPDALSDWSDGNYRIVIPYYTYTAALVGDSDTNWFTYNMEDFIINHATAEAFSLDWDYNSMALWLQRADTKFKEARKADVTSRVSGVTELTPHWQGANELRVRR